jgi:hypothetical protein
MSLNKNDEMEKKYETYRVMRKCYKIVTGRPEVKKNLGYHG